MDDPRARTISLGWAVVVTAVISAILLSKGGIGAWVYGGDLHAIYLQKFQASLEALFGRGELPLWNPMEFNGHPLLGVMQGAVLYPPMLFFFGLLDQWTALQAFYIFHYALIAIAVILLLRRSGLSPHLAAFGALVALSAPTNAPPVVDHPGFIAAIAWFPWMLYALDRSLERPVPWLALLATAVCAQCLAGYPEFPINSSILLMIVALFPTSPKPRALHKRLGIAAAGIALGLAMAAIQIAPGIETLVESSRSLEEVRQVRETMLASGSLLPAMPGRFGWAILALSLLSIIHPVRGSWGWVAGAALCIFALTFPINLMYRFPPLSYVRFPFGWPHLYAVLIGSLAAAGASRLIAAERSWLRFAGLAFVGLGVVSCLATATRDGSRPGGFRPPDAQLLRERANFMKSFAVGPFEHARFIAPWDINAGVSLKHDWPTSWGYEPAVNPKRMRRIMKLIRNEDAPTLRRWDESWRRADLLSMVGVGFVVIPRSIARQYQRAGFTLAATMPDAQGLKNNVLVARKPVPRARIVRRLLTATNPEDAYRLTIAPGRAKAQTAVVEGQPALATLEPGQSDVVDSATITYSEPHEVHVSADLAEPGLLVLSDAFFPGWVATVDGDPTEVYRVDYLFRGVALGAGSHEVEFHYRPSSVRIGAIVSTIALTICIGLTLLGRSQRNSAAS